MIYCLHKSLCELLLGYHAFSPFDMIVVLKSFFHKHCCVCSSWQRRFSTLCSTDFFFFFKKPYLVTSTNNMWINDPSICLVHVQYSATQHGAAIISSTRVCYMNSSFSFMVINIRCNMLGNQDLSHSLQYILLIGSS